MFFFLKKSLFCLKVDKFIAQKVNPCHNILDVKLLKTKVFNFQSKPNTFKFQNLISNFKNYLFKKKLLYEKIYKANLLATYTSEQKFYVLTIYIQN